VNNLKANLEWTAGLLVAIALLLVFYASAAPAPKASTQKASAQPLTAGPAEGFEASEYFPEPNHTQLMWRIRAQKVESEEGGKFVLSGMQLEIFQTNGIAAMEVRAPHCIYDFEARTASSTGRLDVASGDGRMRIAGEGFFCRQENLSLHISNRVETTFKDVVTFKMKR
jgi:hypothetical protein